MEENVESKGWPAWGIALSSITGAMCVFLLVKRSNSNNPPAVNSNNAPAVTNPDAATHAGSDKLGVMGGGGGSLCTG